MKKIGLMMSIVAGSLQAGVPTFELYNKAKEKVWVRLKNGGSVVKDQGFDFFESKPGDHKQFNIDLSKPSQVDIWFHPPFSYKVWAFTSVFDPKMPLREPPDVEYKLPAGKTLYLTLGPEKWTLRPQTGRWRGFRGETESHLPQKNNVSSKEIKLENSSVRAQLLWSGRSEPRLD